MINVYVLDRNLKLYGVIDNYESLIWCRKYREVGDCEISLAATPENVEKLQKGFYLYRTDDDMVCVIKKIEISTNADGKNQMIVKGYDVLGYLDQRVMYGVLTPRGSVEGFIRSLVTDSCITTADSPRRFKKADGSQLIELGTESGFTEQKDVSYSYKKIGETIRTLCKEYGWGYRMPLNQDSGRLSFGLYNGTDRSRSVRFSSKWDNLSTAKYTDDITNLGNVAVASYISPYSSSFVVGDYGGEDKGVERYEFPVSGSGVNRQITFKSLKQQYPGGRIQNDAYLAPSGTRIQVFTLEQKKNLSDDFSGFFDNSPTDPTVLYFVTNQEITVAELPKGTNTADNDNVILAPAVYNSLLLASAQEQIKNYGEKVTFEGSVIPNITYTYKQDYFLGDIVSVADDFGNVFAARITEVLENLDVNGYRFEPKFEYTQITSVPITDYSIYGVSGLGSNYSSTTLTRTDDAAEKAFSINRTTGEITSDFNNLFPWNEAKIIYTAAGKFLQLPDMYFRVGRNVDREITDIAVSKRLPEQGFADWFKVDSFAVSCYGGSVDGGKLKSVSGVNRLSDVSRSTFAQYAAANGSGYSILDIYHKTVLSFLWMIEFATKDSASVMTGRISGSGTQGGTAARQTGGTDSVSTQSGYEMDYGQMRYHYIEDFVGNYLDILADDVQTVSYTLPESGCVAALGWDSDNPFICLPITTSGTDFTQYFCDNWSNDDPTNSEIVTGAMYDSDSDSQGLEQFGTIAEDYAEPTIGGRLILI